MTSPPSSDSPPADQLLPQPTGRAPFCGYFVAGRCQSCGLLKEPEETRTEGKDRRIRELLLHELGDVPVTPMYSPPTALGSRNKTKLSVLGTTSDPIIGILGPIPGGTDLEECPLTPPEVQKLIGDVKGAIKLFNLTPYDIAARRGELKGVMVFINHNRSEGMLRFVLRSSECIPRLQKALPAILGAHTWIKVVSANFQPLPAAIPEGPTEMYLSEERCMRESYNGIGLYFAPQSFMQVTHDTAQALYRTAAEWIGEVKPTRVLDLFCGVGGFALHAACHATNVTGVEISEQAIECAERAAKEAGFENVRFMAGDVDRLLTTLTDAPDLVVVNPPRRGLSDTVKAAILRWEPETVLYSSCNPTTFLRDVKELAGKYSLRKVSPFDMFPLTEHVEVLGLLVRDRNRNRDASEWG